ncbi:MAG TPA: Ohr family peroxiredoxin [Clostridia bacterium]|nr:Ohr family peroxiredoxin [Clostridia bacterium]
MDLLYTTTATSVNGRSGTVTVAQSPLVFEMSPPKGLGGSSNDGVNPEQLFAAGYAACFAAALHSVIRSRKLRIPLPKVQLEVGIGKDEGGGFALAAKIHGVFSELDKAEAMSLMDTAHEICPYSKATRGNIKVDLSAEAQ